MKFEKSNYFGYVLCPQFPLHFELTTKYNWKTAHVLKLRYSFLINSSVKEINGNLKYLNYIIMKMLHIMLYEIHIYQYPEKNIILIYKNN